MKAWSILAIALACCTAAVAQGTRQAPDQTRLDYRLQPRQIAADTWVIEGAVADFLPANGCNIINTAFIATGDGVVVVNTGPSRLYGEQQRRAIAAVTPQPVRMVLNLNLHPDYFFGNQAWGGVATQALAGSIAGMRAEGGGYADNLYRLCGDWMKGTEPTPAREALEPKAFTLGTHRLELRRLQGHTQDDLVLLDATSGVLFAGGLVFAERVPTTPHAHFAQWLQSLATLEQWRQQGQFKLLVPSHGPVDRGLQGIAQTRDWLQWLTALLEGSAPQGVDLSELLHTPIPSRFASWAAQPAELQRSLVQWYPAYERRALTRPPQ
ncbi:MULTISPECIES: quinoprotein relay system zinc metallohydrolase 1 [Acidovorax]|uniref:Quinoprotein relay system zinc metallohydrolase 1 n=1 Tax=Acidovorax soli TaxID=592050 RepID=A0A1H4EBK6_9BURK|nr:MULTISPECIES: quinoprotein relay system zinc metallohydrolase 1 [Acidovorax]SEA82316.1 quinoprotein relay system zinc metallohydrolase 1 [Acidovorax soli]